MATLGVLCAVLVTTLKEQCHCVSDRVEKMHRIVAKAEGLESYVEIASVGTGFSGPVESEGVNLIEVYKYWRDIGVTSSV